MIVDRPRGSAHPKVPEYVYPLDYGYLEGTNGGDGSGIDVWRGAAHRRGVTAVLCAFDPVKRNSELKVVMDCTGDELGGDRVVLSAAASGGHGGPAPWLRRALTAAVTAGHEGIRPPPDTLDHVRPRAARGP